MTEAAIKRVNFFDGQFLKQGEFLGLENYHRHMRRRLLHMLFDQSGVVQLNTTDLKVLIADAAQKLITVKAGLAIGKRDDLVEAKEIVLREDQLIDLDGVIPSLQNGDTSRPVFGVLIVAWLWHAPVPANERALPIAAGLLLILPLVAAALGHMTGLALGPLFIVPIFVISVQMGLQRSM